MEGSERGINTGFFLSQLVAKSMRQGMRHATLVATDESQVGKNCYISFKQKSREILIKSEYGQLESIDFS